MAQKEPGTGEPASENPAPTLAGYESFHVTANKEISRRVATVLAQAGVRSNEAVWHVIGRTEYVIEVHRDDLAKADEAFAKDLGPRRTVASEGGESSAGPHSSEEPAR